MCEARIKRMGEKKGQYFERSDGRYHARRGLNIFSHILRVKDWNIRLLPPTWYEPFMREYLPGHSFLGTHGDKLHSLCKSQSRDLVAKLSNADIGKGAKSQVFERKRVKLRYAPLKIMAICQFGYLTSSDVSDISLFLYLSHHREYPSSIALSRTHQTATQNLTHKNDCIIKNVS